MYLSGFRRTLTLFSVIRKRSPGTEQAFPAWENVPLEPGKLFPLGKTFPWNRASFSRLGKRSPGTGQAFPAWENVPLEPSKLFPLGKMFPTSRVCQVRRHGGRMRYAPTYLPFARWGCSEGWLHLV